MQMSLDFRPPVVYQSAHTVLLCTPAHLNMPEDVPERVDSERVRLAGPSGAPLFSFTVTDLTARTFYVTKSREDFELLHWQLTGWAPPVSRVRGADASVPES